MAKSRIQGIKSSSSHVFLVWAQTPAEFPIAVKSVINPFLGSFFFFRPLNSDHVISVEVQFKKVRLA